MNIDTLTDTLWNMRDSDKASKADFKAALKRALEEQELEINKDLIELGKAEQSDHQYQIQQLTAQLAAAREQYKDLARIASARYCGHCDLGYQEDDCTCGNYALATPSPAADQLLQDRELVSWIRDNCKVIYWPNPESYPIEHAPFAGKDSWQMILDARQAKASSGEAQT